MKLQIFSQKVYGTKLLLVENYSTAERGKLNEIPVSLFPISPNNFLHFPVVHSLTLLPQTKFEIIVSPIRDE